MNDLARINARLLSEPEPTLSLAQLADDLNALANIRQNARVAFCRRLAAAYLLIVGHRPNTRSSDGSKFREWCDKNIHSANKKPYSHRTLELYLIIGFSKNPEKIVRQRVDDANRRAHHMRRFGAAIAHAVENNVTALPVTKIRKQFDTTGDVAQEINALMRAWEQASTTARNHFLYLVSGQKIAS